MKSVFAILVLFLFLGMVSCNPTDDQELEQSELSQSVQAVNPPPGEITGEEDELDIDD